MQTAISSQLLHCMQVNRYLFWLLLILKLPIVVFYRYFWCGITMTPFCLSAIVHHPKSKFCRSRFWASLLSSFSFTHTEILSFSIEKLRKTMMCSSLCKHDKVGIFFEFWSGKSMLEREKWVPIELGGMRVYASIVTPFNVKRKELCMMSHRNEWKFLRMTL